MKTVRYLVVSIFSGVVFGILDGLVHANPIAQELLLVFQPIARSSVNIPAGIAIDLMYGFVLAGIFLILYKSIPGKTGWTKGLNYGLFVWFLRVVMYVASTWMMFDVPQTTLFYLLLTGLGEMLVIGLIYGVFLKPES
jgi:hypothetical protein